MLIELIKIGRRIPGRAVVARVRTPFGEVAAAWRGDPAAAPGAYHVEWTIDEDVVWGRNAEPAGPESGPGITEGGHCAVFLRGWLDGEEDGVLAFRLGDSRILLESAEPLPDGVVPGRVRLRFDRERIQLFPYAV